MFPKRCDERVDDGPTFRDTPHVELFELYVSAIDGSDLFSVCGLF